VSQLIASELLKLRTTRTFLGLALAALVLSLLIVGLGGALSDYGPADEPARDLLSSGGIAQPCAFALGILAVSTEFRHGTITPTLLVVPSRKRLVLAKVAAHGLAGLLLGLAVFGLAALLAFPILAVRDVSTQIDVKTAVEVVAGGIACVTLLAMLGVGIGAVVRNQVGAIMGAIGWWFVAEPLIASIPTIGPPVEDYGLGGAISAAAAETLDGGSDISQIAGVLLLVAYVAIFAAAGIAVLRQRDVTA
jgi:ABC-2 type transport system permease protein